jgi:hypothetical protein
MVEKQNEKLKSKGKATVACPDAKSSLKRKASGGLSDPIPKKVCSEKFCQHCKAHGGPYQTYNTFDCRHYDSNGKPLAAAASKPSESKKPYKKFGSNQSIAFMQIILEAYVKAKKAGKSKKCKKRDHESSDSFDSE